MGTTIKLVTYKTQETEGYLDHLADDIKASAGSDSDLLLDHPAIYIHVWRNKYDILSGKWSIYVGETNDILKRTKEHWAAARIPEYRRRAGNWQFHMLEDTDDKDKRVIPTVYFFGHKLFQKSLTLDIENRLIDYFLSMETAHTYNGRGNIQGSYSGDEELDTLFGMIWRTLRKDNPELFLTEASIKKSAIYKASPNHRLTEDQSRAKQLIIDRTVDAIISGKTNQLVFVEGEAGTGKTVLTSSAFFGVMDNELLRSLDLSCYMLINHDEQLHLYKNMVKKLGYKDDIIENPTKFLNDHSVKDEDTGKYSPDPDNMVDLVFVDEAHLLWDKSTQGYSIGYSEPQLDEIIKRARVTVIMFDENQRLNKYQITTMDYMLKKRELAKSQGPDPAGGKHNYIQLVNQLRMNCSKDTLNWIDGFSKGLTLNKLSLNKAFRDENNYEIRVFDSPKEMHEAIKEKALKDETQLSRVIASYDWKYNRGYKCIKQKYWQVEINGWTLPWNNQLFEVDIKSKLNSRQRRRYDALDWAERPYSIDEAGSIFTIQGFDLAFAGVILGPSVRYDKSSGKIWFDESKRKQDKMKGSCTLRDGKTINVTDMISQHELRVLLTRATQGLYIYACDDELRNELKNCIIADQTK